MRNTLVATVRKSRNKTYVRDTRRIIIRPLSASLSFLFPMSSRPRKSGDRNSRAKKAQFQTLLAALLSIMP